MTPTQHVKLSKIQKEKDNCISLFFKKPTHFTFTPGDCFDLFFTEKDFDEGRIFSFSSSPTEKELRVTFRKGISEYKKRLEKAKVGDTFGLLPYGSPYTFFLDRPLLFYAGGIGITVFRSIYKYVVDKKLKTDLTLIFSNRTEDFIFKEELDQWAMQLDSKVHYVPTQKVGRVTRENLRTFIPDLLERNYYHYLVGPPAMVDDTKEILTSLEIEDKNIHTDSFDGYYGEDE